MKKFLKIVSFFMVVVIISSFCAVSASAVATPLDAGSSKDKAANIPSFGTEYVSELSKVGEIDWFKFTTLSEDAYYTVSFKLYSLPTGSSYNYGPNFTLYDMYLQEIDTDYRSTSFNYKLEPNCTYYIKINGAKNYNGTGTYEVKVDYVYDAEENYKDGATKINLNQSYIKSLDGFTDEDWFKFTAQKSGEYVINFTLNSLPTGTSSGFATNCSVYDEYLKTLATGYNSRTFTLNLEAGQTYYIRVFNSEFHNCTGTYEIKVNNKSASTIDLSVALSSITLEKGGSLTVGCSYTGTYDGSLTIRYDIEDKDIVSCQWEGWESKQNFLTVKALKAGSTVITISMIDTDTREVLDSEKLTVKVTENTSNIDLSVPLDTITLEKGESIKFFCKYTGSHNGKLTIQYKIDDKTIASCEWGEWESREVPLTVKALEAGSTVITVSMIDTDTREVLDSEKINFNVTENNSSNDSDDESSGLFIIDVIVAIWTGIMNLINWIFGL